MSATLIPPVTNGVRSGRHHHHHQHHGRSHKRVQPLSLSHQPQPSPSQADLLTPPSHGLPSTPRSPLFSGLIDVMEKDTGLPFHDSASSPEVTVLSEKPTEHTAKPPPEHKHPSRISLRLLKASEKWPLLHAILKERDSRRIFYFMSLNFSFMVVQLLYGITTGSLGLLSDSIHMLFDCFALAVGLSAAVMSKWPPSARFPFGYGKVDTLAGFANGVSLLIISIEIIFEAFERLISGSELNRLGELFIVSTLGLIVNMVGILAFDHAHHHGHGHSHSHGDHHHENMHGIYLHILADALGSVAVVGSTVLVHFFGWAGFDPIASCIIAVLIFVSAIPLVKTTAKTLLLAVPADVEYNLRDTLAGISTLRGVAGYTVPKFWLDDTQHDKKHGHGHHHNHHHRHGSTPSHARDCNDHTHSHGEKEMQNILGVIHVIASRGTDMADVQRRTIDYLRERNMDILVQVEREGEGRCWCGGGNKFIS
ncbi:cation efflux family protein [Coccidioides posadasii C735 delta SOWgp]|uniref:Zinc transporter n=1 Tax=Coccidioides posadasii (strain C735) TaxID=222929 RepID=C5P1X4_COCP7|nr:cation efflux family protein [Coccidioides posadasii C735 delta SOWgp]EER28877.1 cation efflux family protein [Coccidioides posadasii C735 delta SOWgp]|eukprot:XP_003071022.1 cation efflux family protein [Coccidioides posadasii C735 delta SOWgp]